MWFPYKGQEGVVKTTGRRIRLSSFLNDETIVAEGSIWQAVLGDPMIFKLSDVDLIWPDFMPPGQRCKCGSFRLDAVE